MQAESLLKRAESLSVYNELPEPKSVWKYFLSCTEIPRPSHKLEAFTEHLKRLAPQLGCECFTDEAGNVLFRKPASAGCEQAPSTVIQCHMDMVCVKAEGVDHDFDRDPITTFIDGTDPERQHLKARGTTLGADDGIGVATCLAIAEDNSLKHGPLEFLFTADEETTMGGAENLAPAPFIQSKYLINVDSEEEGRICVGCAGGAEHTFTVPVTQIDITEPTKFRAVSISVEKLLGGHTGCDIHKGLGNAIRIIARLLQTAISSDNIPVHLAEFSGGIVINAIPRVASATVLVPEDSEDAFKRSLQSNFETLSSNLKSVEPEMAIVVNSAEVRPRACKPDDLAKFCELILDIPHGVLRMSEDVEGLVDTSNSCSLASLHEDHFFIHTFARSSYSQRLAEFREQVLTVLADKYGAQLSQPLNPFPAWEPKVTSPLLTVTKEASREVWGKDADVYIVHAGLECGFIQGQYPTMDCVSIGPQIDGAHSPDERILISSVARFYDITKRIIEKIANLRE